MILSGGQDLWRSTNGGLSFTKITQWSSWPNSPHADHHVAIEDPGYDGVTNRRVYIGNDGGIWKTEDVYAAATLVRLDRAQQPARDHAGLRRLALSASTA